MDWPIIVILLSVAHCGRHRCLGLRQRRCSQQLRGRFGREYDRTIETEGDRRKAEKTS